MSKNKFIVVSVHRDRWYYPKLSIVVETRVSSAPAAQRFITEQVMSSFVKRMRGKKGQFISIRVKDFRVVDELGLKRLRAAAKASATVRRKRAAKKAAVTRAKNKAARMARTAAARAANERMRREASPPEYYPATQGYEVAGDASVN